MGDRNGWKILLTGLFDYDLSIILTVVITPKPKLHEFITGNIGLDRPRWIFCHFVRSGVVGNAKEE